MAADAVDHSASGELRAVGEEGMVSLTSILCSSGFVG